MRDFKATCFLLVGIFISVQGISQSIKNRIQPGRMYKTGEKLYAPRFGFTSTVPEGWEGMLPRESEVFLLTTTTSTYGEIFVFGREKGDFNTLRNEWMKGVELSDGIQLKAINPTINNELLSAEVTAVGEYINKGYKAFAISRCSSTGPCITTLMIAPQQFYDSVKKSTMQFMSVSSFVAPSNTPPYIDFKWKEFLANKVLLSFAAVQGGTKENQIHLCANGTFYSEIVKTGFFKNENPKYQGKNSGEWVIADDGIGESTSIQFTFKKKKLQPFTTTLVMSEEKVLINDERYFVGKSDKCK